MEDDKPWDVRIFERIPSGVDTTLIEENLRFFRTSPPMEGSKLTHHTTPHLASSATSPMVPSAQSTASVSRFSFRAISR